MMHSVSNIGEIAQDRFSESPTNSGSSTNRGYLRHRKQEKDVELGIMPVGASRDEVPPTYNSESLAGIASAPEHEHEVEENSQSAPDTRVGAASLERIASPEEVLKKMTDGLYLHSATLSRRPRSKPVIHHLDLENRKSTCALADKASLSFTRNGFETSVEGTLATKPMFVGFLEAENAAVPK